MDKQTNNATLLITILAMFIDLATDPTSISYAWPQLELHIKICP